jgi:hypothetical protein
MNDLFQSLNFGKDRIKKDFPFRKVFFYSYFKTSTGFSLEYFMV